MTLSPKLSLCVAAALAAVIGAARPASAEPGLLLVAHGSPSPKWNEPVLEFGARVAEAAAKTGKFKATRTALLESAQPDIPSAVAELEAEGCDRIIAVPLFIAPSGHSHFDVPAALGIYTSSQVRETLREEGASPARPRVPITLTETLSEGDLLATYAADQARKLSISPEKEALVVLVHGDPEHALMIERMMRRIVTRCCGATGIGYGDWASIGVGQEYASSGIPAIHAALDHADRVLVLGIYLSSTAASLDARARGMMRERNPQRDPLAGRDVVFSSEPLIQHPALLEHVLAAAQAALEPPVSPDTAAVTER